MRDFTKRSTFHVVCRHRYIKSVKSLSGGEAIRLQLCQLFLGEYNILLLDEPTNF